MEMPLPISVKAMCLFIHNGRVLVATGNSLRSRDKDTIVEPGNFYRAIGGSLQFGETSEEGVRREVQEELGSEIGDLELVDVIESIFEYEGQQNHEICFLYMGRLLNESVSNVDILHVVEDTYEFDAEWIKIEEILDGNTPLYPVARYSDLLSRVRFAT